MRLLSVVKIDNCVRQWIKPTHHFCQRHESLLTRAVLANRHHNTVVVVGWELGQER